MKGLLARFGVAVALFVFAAGSATWSMEPASAQGQAAAPTAVPGSPSVMIQIEDDNVVVGDPARVTLIAFDDGAVDWIRWDARLSVDIENDNWGQADNEDGDNVDVLVATTPTPTSENDNEFDDDEDNEDEDNENWSQNDNWTENDNMSADTDPGLGALHEFECDEQTACANVWTIPTSKPGRYTIRAEVRDSNGLRGYARAEIQVRATR
jgi:hypothetical protein